MSRVIKTIDIKGQPAGRSLIQERLIATFALILWHRRRAGLFPNLRA
jgi:hypothetical protein